LQELKQQRPQKPLNQVNSLQRPKLKEYLEQLIDKKIGGPINLYDYEILESIQSNALFSEVLQKVE